MQTPQKQTGAAKSDKPQHAPWYDCAVIYELDVETFQDSNGDGIGDFAGAIARLGYVASLGVDCVWVQPFYPSPGRDNGYDICDYYGVDTRFGTLDDFDAFVREANAQGLRVMLDLPLNHTSNEHPWFQEARRNPNSRYRPFYVWADQRPANDDEYVIFPGVQESNWNYDEQAGQYYFHTFYDFMPDLNIANPEVRQELVNIVRFWMKRGIDGFRLDALPFIVVDRSEGEHLEEPYELLEDLNAVVREIKADAVLLAEADKKPQEMQPFFGNGNRMHLLLNFYLCNHMYLALADGKAEPIARAWRELPRIPEEGQWANFLRNHDELSLSQLEDDERERVFAAFAPEKRMQAYERGIRRRLAPMLDGDPRRLRLMYSLLFSLPGTPVLFYGDEIGMGENLDLKERNSVRTPMQWNADRNAGFSTSKETVLPVITDGPFAASRVNVESQEHDQESLLHFVRRAIRAYQRHPAFARGEWSFLDVGTESVLAHCCEFGNDRVFALHNLTAQACEVQMPFPAGIEEVMCDTAYESPTAGRTTLGPYGFRWFRDGGEGGR